MKKLLLIDDNITLIKILSKVLSAYYQVATFSNSLEAVKYISDKKNQLEIVISDYKMPDLNGLQVLEKVKETNPSAVRILLTGYAEDAVLERKENVYDKIIDKSVCRDIKELIKIINNVENLKRG